MPGWQMAGQNRHQEFPKHVIEEQVIDQLNPQDNPQHIPTAHPFWVGGPPGDCVASPADQQVWGVAHVGNPHHASPCSLLLLLPASPINGPPGRITIHGNCFSWPPPLFTCPWVLPLTIGQYIIISLYKQGSCSLSKWGVTKNA